MMGLLHYAFVPLMVSSTLAQNSSYDPLQYVDQLIGSANYGDIFAGASLPYGMAKAVGDVDSEDNQGGFTTEGGNVTGFSGMHDSGTGGSPSLGNFALFPYISCEDDHVNGCQYPKNDRKTRYVNASVKASPGYFGLQLDNGIIADMTVARHTSLFRFKFPESDASGRPARPLIIVDLTDLSLSRQDNATISVDDEGHMTGNARFLPSFGEGNYVLYFCADFSGAARVRDSGIFVNNRASTDVKNFTFAHGYDFDPVPAGAFVRFDDLREDKTITVRVATSFISSDHSCKHAHEDIPTFNFKETRSAAKKAWQNKFSPIRVSTNGVARDLLVNFYSGIYRTLINPQDYTGENPLWESEEPYFDSFYCLWDSFRSQLPFLTILDPESVTRMVRSLIDTFRHDGWLPDCRMSLCRGYTQGGSNADVVLGDGLVKGLLNGIEWEDGYAAVVRDAEVEPYDWLVRGRGGLDSWKRLHYIPSLDFDYKGVGLLTRSISRTLEYSYNDFVIAQMAKRLDKPVDVEKYTARSESWRNLYKSDQKSFLNGTDTGFVGFFQPRYLNSTWGEQDPLYCSNIDYTSNDCSLQIGGSETYESSVWEYSFFVPHDQAGLITAMGGPEAFVKRLDYLHDQNITYIGNEPAFLTVFQYHYAGRPALSAKRAHYYIPEFFKTTHDGLPGNDDSGAMGSFVALSMMGLFPNPGQDVYLIVPPFFESVSIKNAVSGKTATVRNVNFDPKYEAIYIQRATLDGKPYTKNWVDHSFFTEGKELVLELGTTESEWGTRVADLPPSLSEYAGFGV